MSPTYGNSRGFERRARRLRFVLGVPRDDLRRKLTVRAGGRTLVLVKRPEESGEHVLQKALLWVLYLPQYPDLRVEQRLPRPNRYRPDLFAVDAVGAPVLWAECGAVGAEKLERLLRGHPATHFVFSKWATRLDPAAARIDAALAGARRDAPVELIGVPADAEDWFTERGVRVRAEALEIRRWAPSAGRAVGEPRARRRR